MRHIAAVVLMCTASTYSTAIDRMSDRLSTNDKSYVLTVQSGVLLPPSFKGISADAANGKNRNVIITALVSVPDVLDPIRFEQSCSVLPAKSFIAYASEEANSARAPVPDFVYMYQFMSEKGFTPKALMLCVTSELNLLKWRSLLHSLSFHQAIASDGTTFAYAIHSSGTYFFY